MPDYAAISAPLHELLENCCSQVGGRTSKKLTKLSVSTLWEPTHTNTVHTLQQTVFEQTELAYPNPDFDICLRTDASDIHWCGVLTQVNKHNRHLPLENQFHESPCFVSGSFNSTSKSWTTAENEAYAVV